MATGKKYYWMKLKVDFMTSDTVDFFMSQPNGANYVVLYQLLCLKTINTNGRLERQIGEILIPYDVQKIKRDCKWFTEDTIMVALKLYQQFGLIYEDSNGTLVLADHSNLVGMETDYAEQKRRQREIGVDIVHTTVHTDIRDKSIDKEIDIHSTICTEAKLDAKAETETIIIELPLNTGEMYRVTDKDYEYYQGLYPAVDILSELRAMRGWLDANPRNRKTAVGIKRFINSWLSKEQDRAPRASSGTPMSAKEAKAGHGQERHTNYNSMVMDELIKEMS